MKGRIFPIIGFLLVLFLIFAVADLSKRRVEISKEARLAKIGAKQYNIVNAEKYAEDNQTRHLYQLRRNENDGKNFIILPENTTIKNAKELLESIPECEAVNYWNGEEWVAWLPVAGGIGTNFEVEPGVVYEVFVKKEVNWTI